MSKNAETTIPCVNLTPKFEIQFDHFWFNVLVKSVATKLEYAVQLVEIFCIYPFFYQMANVEIGLPELSGLASSLYITPTHKAITYLGYSSVTVTSFTEAFSPNV